ncbi:protein SRG1 [Senna tora]|uniref:Protein SRG1 n=1 Tax=Senna tora TaxID=362788 RepID=A0A834W7C3_9FABA|nr:protein SRG1 [Senna tora]
MEEPVQRNLTTASASASMELPSVKELAKEGLAQVPKRYLRAPSELEHPPNDNTPSSLEEVPVIDLSKLLSPQLHASELQKLDSACKEWGFFQLVNHGVDSSLVECIKKETAEFFDLPMEEKKKLWQKPEDGQGFGQLFVASEEQKLEWADLFVIITLPEEIRAPRLFSNIPQPFRDHLNTYCLELKKLAMKIIELMAEALNIDPKEIVELFEKGCQSMRMNYYPPCPEADKVIGLNPHSDISGITILLQLNEIKGLQIRKDGKWSTVTPLPNAFIINIGDTLEVVSNGIYRSIEHRAIVNKEKERISIATFFAAALDKTIGPVPSLVTPQTPAVYRSIGMSDFLKRYFSRELGGKSHLDFIRIKKEEKQESKPIQE